VEIFDVGKYFVTCGQHGSSGYGLCGNQQSHRFYRDPLGFEFCARERCVFRSMWAPDSI
jgi:hypothetical protein